MSSVPFSLVNLEEMVNGDVRLEWETVADDGLTLIEGDTFTPDPTLTLEEAVTVWLTAIRTRRGEINDEVADRAKPRKAAVKRTTAVLSPQALDRIRSVVEG